MRFQKYAVTLTSDASGDASATIENVTGRLLKVVTLGVTQPTASWDLAIKAEIAGVDETIFSDTARSNSTTAPDVSYPVAPANKTADDSASSLTEVFPIIYGPVTITGANMGASKSAKVILIVEAA